MKAKLIKKDGHYFLEVEPNTWTPPNRFHSIIANTLDKKEGDVLQLSLKNCQAIERGYDLDELFNEVDESIDYHEFDFTSFRIGFQKALELTEEKMYSQMQLLNAIRMAKTKKCETFDNSEEEILKYFKPFLSWEVEIVKEIIDYGLDESCNPQYSKAPKHDENGCLILKRV